MAALGGGAQGPGSSVTPPQTAVQKALGMEFSAMTPALRKQYNIRDNIDGVVVTRIDATSPAADKRVQAGNVIVEINQQPVKEPRDIASRMADAKKQGRKSALFLVSNGQGEVRFVALPVE
jgi:serine protease Do